MQKTPLAILVSDLHFSNNPPAARAGEDFWYDALARPLEWLRGLSARHGVPIIAAGDIWDKPNQHPGIVNAIIDTCPPMYAIPGQHDLPSHLFANRGMSAYGTLVRAGVLTEIDVIEPQQVSPGFYIMGFPWGFDLQRGLRPRDGVIAVAVCHKYIHNGAHTHYVGAGEEHCIGKALAGLEGFAVVHCGDNHIPFEARTAAGALVVNTGAFYRRAADQVNFRPSAVVLYRTAAGVVSEREYYDTSEEAFSVDHLKSIQSVAEAHGRVDEFLGALGSTGGTADFRTVVRNYVSTHGDSMGPVVSDMITAAVNLS